MSENDQNSAQNGRNVRPKIKPAQNKLKPAFSDDSRRFRHRKNLHAEKT